MTLITEEYRRQNQTLHETRKDYGMSGGRWAPIVWQLHRDLGSTSILDYGCGKGLLARDIEYEHGFEVAEYDPAIPGKDAEPSKADLVACTDVMEHIEPENLVSVLDHIKALAKKAVFITIATRPAVKFLPDGRNAHLIVEPLMWWLPKLCERWELLQVNNVGGQEFVFVGRALNG